MVHWEIGTDPRLKHLDVRVYFVLAGCRRGPTVKIGTRLIAKYACTSQRRVIESITRLKSCGYIENRSVKNGARAEYRLTAEKFAAAQKPVIGARFSDIGKAGRGRGLIRNGELTPTMVHCPRCSKTCGGLLKVGWCRRCNGDDRMRRIADEQIVRAKSA
jgi:hypothetical protein